MVPQRVHTVVISCQHDDDVSNEKIRSDLQEHVIKHVVPAKYLDAETIYHLNPSGRFVIGGPHGDAGLTGRKIIIDTYGGWGAHGGGAFSGKDPTKVSFDGTPPLMSWPPFGVASCLVFLVGEFCMRIGRVVNIKHDDWYAWNSGRAAPVSTPTIQLTVQFFRHLGDNTLL